VAVPSTAIALLVFLTLLVPGFIGSLIGERDRARQQRSIFREMVSIACISFAADAVALLIFAVVRITWPGVTPDVGALIRHPNGYVARHYALLAWWSLATPGRRAGPGQVPPTPPGGRRGRGRPLPPPPRQAAPLIP